MNILELDSYNLADAVKFHSQLNPRIWGRDEHLLPQVREKLLAIAEDFQEFLGVPDLNVQDITISGSNAAYSYTANSDIDLHLVVTMPEDPVYQELFNAKKYQYNDEHDIRIGGADVELYVQPADQPHHSQGIYSVKNNDWIQVPRRQRATIDDACVRDKVADLDARIHAAIESSDQSRMTELWHKIKAMRQSGLQQHGEFGCENIAFKILRTKGCLAKLKTAITQAQDRAMSLAERNRPRQRVRYGFGESPDGVDPTTKMFLEEPIAESPDGVNPTTAMFLTEDDPDVILQKFIKHTADRLGIERMPEIHIHHNEDWSEQHHSFGMYVPERHELHVSLGNRHLLDILRTTAHELCHCRQHEIESMPHNAGNTGSDWENEAHAVAGIIMRDFADAHTEYFNMEPIEESASGYIPKNKKEARDPRYKMAVSVDVGPGQVGKEANKLALHTGRNGEPALLMKTANLRESAMGQQFLGEYPSIATVNEAPKDLVKYKKGQEKQIHRDLALTHPGRKDFDYSGEERDWDDSHFVQDYTGGTSQYINNILHQHYRKQAGKKDLKRHQRHIASMDRALAAKKLKQPITVYTGVPVSPADAWEKYGADVSQPIKLHLPAYTSTSTNLRVVQELMNDRGEAAYVDRQRHPPRNARRAPIDPEGNQILMLSIPAGTPAASVRKISEYPDENEILMPRGIDIVVSPNPTVLEDGDYVWHAEVIGHNPVQIAQPKGFKESLAEYSTAPREEPVEDFDGLQFKIISYPHNQIRVGAYAPGSSKEIAHALFDILDYRQIEPLNLHVDEKFRGQGIAKTMYDYVKSKGYAIHRSWDQTDAGAGFWDKHRGEDRVWEEDLAESLRQEFALFEEQDLFEIRMSPSSLRQEAAKTGARAGMEFEMIVPGRDSYQDFEPEPDYGHDPRTRSFSDIRDFFHDGNYNGRRDVDRLIEKMEESYYEWLDEQIEDDWQSEGEDYLRDMIVNNGYFDDAEAQEEATNALQAEYGNDISPEEFQKMLDALVQDKLNEFVEEQWNSEGNFYDEAREAFREEKQGEYDETEWLRDEYPNMSDVSASFDISWPYWTEPDEDGGNVDIESVADDFGNAVGKRVNWSSSYHGGRREPNAYVVEPDGSLDPDSGEDMGLEFVSPPMPIDEMIDQLNEVQKWAKGYGCYTNDSTGLHINISVPGFSRDKLDFVKLALLLGDKYVLEQFGRSSNTYAASALDKVKRHVRDMPDAAKNLLEKMKGHMEDMASKIIHSGVTAKYTSINTKEGYIEFRSPGGDWLDENFDKIENTLLRFTVALSAAVDPEAYRQEYLKKLYKLLEPVAVEEDIDTIRYFADYVAGKTPRAALRSFVKQAQLQRRVKRGDVGNVDYWWEVSNPAHSFASIEVVAKTREEAIEKALSPTGYPSWQNTRNTVTAKPLRPYDKSPVKAQAGEPQPLGQQSTRRYRILRHSTQETVDNKTFPTLQSAVEYAQANGYQIGRGYAVEEIPPTQSSQTGNMGTQREMERRLGWPDQTGELANYEIVRRDNMTTVFVLAADNDREAMRKYGDWLAAAGYPEDTENFGIRRKDGGQMDLSQPNPQRAYEIIRGMDRDDVVVAFLAADDLAAIERLNRYRNEHPGTEYNIVNAPIPGSTLDLQRQRAQQQAQDQSRGGLIDVAGETPTQAPRTLTVPGQPQQQFTGNWLVLDPDDNVLYRFGGVGNNQNDANRVAMEWLRRNQQYQTHGVLVRPEMA